MYKMLFILPMLLNEHILTRIKMEKNMSLHYKYAKIAPYVKMC